MNRALLIFVACFNCFTSPVLSAPRGSFPISDIRDLLTQKPALWKQVDDDFEVYPIGVGRMISRAENVTLNGVRIGPYRFWAKAHGRQGPFTYEIDVDTKATFYDKDGNLVTLEKASRHSQEVTSICVRPLTAEEYFSP